MNLSYSDMKLFEQKLDAILAAVQADKEAALAVLRAENEKLKAEIAGAVDATAVVGQAARDGLPE